MTHEDWITILAPTVAASVVALAGIAAAFFSGLTKKASAWLTLHNQAALAQAVAAAGAVIQPALQTGASAIAAKIASGALDYTDKSAIAAEAQREVSLVEARVPGMIAIAAPVAGALVASMVAKVDAVMAPVAAAGSAVAPSAVEGVVAAAKTLTDVRAALDAVAVPLVPSAPAPVTAPSLITA